MTSQTETASRLTSIELTNVRGHGRTEVPLERFTLLVGDNGVGKTSVLYAAQVLGACLSRPPAEVVRQAGGVEALLRSGGAGSGWVRLGGTADGAAWSLRLDLPRGAPAVRCGWSLGDSNGERDGGEDPIPQAIMMPTRAAVLTLRAESLAAPSVSDAVVPQVQADGSGLATALLNLRATDLPAYQRCELALRQIVPSVRGISIGRVPQERTIVELLEVAGQQVRVPKTVRSIADEVQFQFEDTAPLSARFASEGTLIALGILAYLYGPESPRLVLLDDLERGLHPRAQAELVKALRAVLLTRPDVQIVATTHSPYLADFFAPSEVVVLGRPNGGEVVARRLSEHPDQKLLKTLTTGEFLAASGAGWFDP